jgi:GNAT superfamily N-acetyltransferase
MSVPITKTPIVTGVGTAAAVTQSVEINTGSKILTATVIDAKNIAKMFGKGNTYTNMYKDLVEMYARAYFASPVWNPSVTKATREERAELIENFNQSKDAGYTRLLALMIKYAPVAKEEMPSLIEKFNQSGDAGYKQFKALVKKYPPNSTWNKDQIDTYNLNLANLITHKKGQGFFYDALFFYKDLVESNNGIMSIITNKESGKMLGATFVITGKACMDNSTEPVKKMFERKIVQLGSEAESTAYLAEMFVSPELQGRWRAGIVINAMLEQCLQQGKADGLTAIFTWTPIEERNNTTLRSKNPVIRMEEKYGFFNLGDELKGFDLFQIEKGGKIQTGFTESLVGPVRWAGQVLSKIEL